MLKSASTPVRAAHSKLSFEPISQQIRNKIGNAHTCEARPRKNRRGFGT